MKYKFLFTGVLFLSKLIAFGQSSGNLIIKRDYDGDGTAISFNVDKLYFSDSAFIIQANVLANVIADNYVAIFGVSESAATIKEANAKIDERINKFIAAMTTEMRIAKSDMFVDMTTQTQISDYKIIEKTAEQFLSGFEQKKTVSVKFTNIENLDKMIFMAADYGIYDLAKVDYIVTDISKVHNQLFKAAIEMITEKKALYAEATNVKLQSASQIFGESFYSLSPIGLYKNYTPNITTEIEYDYTNYKTKKLKENTTYYYNHANYSGFDKVINPTVTEPMVEFVLLLQIKFDIDKGKK